MSATLLWPLAAFVLTAAAIAVLRPLALRIGLTDKPNQRKQHSGEIPLVGGLAIFIGATAVLFGSVILNRPVAPVDGILAWVVACTLLIAVGVVDDMRGLSPGVRFAAEIVAVLIMIYGGGALLTDLGRLTPDESIVTLGWLAVPFTVFAAVGIINAFNMCDGLDGLSGNLALVTLLAFGIADGLWADSGRVAVTNVISAA
ncbi:MAG: undecaprenyl/decaprenyl-phosphate alpha-N-acetylglucosaminyl 1-phosphate transferase, partial [Gammaproteobacteria bacterium]|nr:undecaprenyl/decaprenyl-phosphate alpha-N-acetylglucosaminyl 1-phosphate transferase [Gammaproteobacteria bacterium]